MSVNAVSSTQADPSVQATQQAERAEAKAADGRDLKHDHDADDGAGAGSGPSVNLSGQVVGSIVNKSA